MHVMDSLVNLARDSLCMLILVVTDYRFKKKKKLNECICVTINLFITI